MAATETRRGHSPLRSNDVKLAAETYDSDDGLVRPSTPLERQIVNLRPSPSPDYLPPPERSPTPERLSRLSNSRGQRHRRPKAQASQGDAVLIGFIGGLNHPDIATKAGEEPLPQSDSDDEPMEVDDDEQISRERSDPVQLAKTAVSMVERGDRRSEDPHGLSKNENARPAFLKIQTQTEPLTSKDRVNGDPKSQQDPSFRAPQPTVNGISRPYENGDRTNRSPSRSKSPTDGDSDSAALSPMVRRYTIPNSERPSEALPAMVNSPTSSSARSPNNQQSLPSLRQIQLEPSLLDASRSNRSPYSMSNGTVNSSPISAIAPRPAHFPSPQTGVNGVFNQQSPYSHHSPSHSGASPSTNMSPPAGKPSSQGYYANARTPQSEESTPQSAVSHRSSSSFSTVPSPHPNQMEIDGSQRRTLPPLPTMPTIPPTTAIVAAGSFKCDYPGCTAQPFQTQYLLNSHANVHSQARPHYCPVAQCPRSEGGKGFKRKNEMIRHGLVHESPGYICPFCPEREHKYPRPDNLQRHVRVNHAGKDMNDPQLRDVLAQRNEGGNRGRRRRLGSG